MPREGAPSDFCCLPSVSGMDAFKVDVSLETITSVRLFEDGGESEDGDLPQEGP